MKDVAVPKCKFQNLSTGSIDSYVREEIEWLESTANHILNGNKEEGKNVSWPGYHAAHQNVLIEAISKMAFLPLFHTSPHTVSMIKHSMEVISNAVNHLNSNQPPICLS